jgi:predicted enzyme involved in methoxymalonyl-ACP biosynthesis
VAEFTDAELHVPIFVLSCRVFGYGVETLVLEQLKKDARERFGAPRVRGFFVETPHNKPCRSMYARHGFVEDSGTWLYREGPSSAPAPVWFAQSAP